MQRRKQSALFKLPVAALGLLRVRRVAAARASTLTAAAEVDASQATVAGAKLGCGNASSPSPNRLCRPRPCRPSHVSWNQHGGSRARRHASTARTPPAAARTCGSRLSSAFWHCRARGGGTGMGGADATRLVAQEWCFRPCSCAIALRNHHSARRHYRRRPSHKLTDACAGLVAISAASSGRTSPSMAAGRSRSISPE